MANTSPAAEARLDQLASVIAQNIGPGIQQLFAELNRTRLNGQGKVKSEISRRVIRWMLEWRTQSITYKMRVMILLADDEKRAFVDRVLVQKEASTPAIFEGHTPTTTMKQVTSVSLEEIHRALMELWPR